MRRQALIHQQEKSEQYKINYAFLLGVYQIILLKMFKSIHGYVTIAAKYILSMYTIFIVLLGCFCNYSAFAQTAGDENIERSSVSKVLVNDEAVKIIRVNVKKTDFGSEQRATVVWNLKISNIALHNTIRYNAEEFIPRKIFAYKYNKDSRIKDMVVARSGDTKCMIYNADLDTADIQHLPDGATYILVESCVVLK